MAGHVDGDTRYVNHVVVFCNGQTSDMAPMDVKNETQGDGEVCEKQGWNTNLDGGPSGYGRGLGEIRVWSYLAPHWRAGLCVGGQATLTQGLVHCRQVVRRQHIQAPH